MEKLGKEQFRWRKEKDYEGIEVCDLVVYLTQGGRLKHRMNEEGSSGPRII